MWQAASEMADENAVNATEEERRRDAFTEELWRYRAN